MGFTALLLTACGFQLRGSYALPYKSVFVSAPASSSVASLIRRTIADGPTQVVASGKDADGQLNIVEELRDKQILSLSGAGRVREYTLRLVVRYQLVDGRGAVIIPTSEIQLSRILAYDDSQIIAKQQEELIFFQDMEKDAVGQILRRMVAVKRPGS
ncbi:MAG: hypothetical protein JNM52_08275 [Betaproteobacteria bacterium]|nr:hypothetical protein [Betaproteobacteria bacterium]